MGRGGAFGSLPGGRLVTLMSARASSNMRTTCSWPSLWDDHRHSRTIIGWVTINMNDLINYSVFLCSLALNMNMDGLWDSLIGLTEYGT